jgi:hypothetical protein
MKKLIGFVFLLFALTTVPAHAGVARTISHAGVSIGKSTANFGKSVGHAFMKWIF